MSPYPSIEVPYRSIEAKYRRTGALVHANNPLIEALPAMETRKDAIVARIAFSPRAFTLADRRKNEMVREAELARLGFHVYPFAEYKGLGEKTTTMIRDAYIVRNPFLPQGRRHQQLLHTHGIGADALRSFHHQSNSIIVCAVTGSGKTTFALRFLAPYMIVIEHTAYRGQPFKRRQIPVIWLSIPHDGTLRSLCLQFFQTVDQILGDSDYTALAKAAKGIANMADLLHRVSSTISLGLLFVDDLQHLRAATGKSAEIVLNFFSQLIEGAGVSLLACGTPALEPVLKRCVANTRKLGSLGTVRFPPMNRKDPQWLAFSHDVWERYSIVREKCPLTEPILDAWHACGGGNPCFTTMSFELAQRRAIGGREILDVDSFNAVSEVEMCMLRPAIQALKKGGPGLLRFDDLLPDRDLASLRQFMGWPAFDELPAWDDKEFPEVEEAVAKAEAAPSQPSVASTKKSDPKEYLHLPSVEPTF